MAAHLQELCLRGRARFRLKRREAHAGRIDRVALLQDRVELHLCALQREGANLDRLHHWQGEMLVGEGLADKLRNPS